MAAYVVATVATPCGWVEDCLCPESAPSPLFTTFTFFCNIVGVVWTGVRIGITTCDADTRTWLILGLCSGIVNILFACYLYGRFTQKVRDEDLAVTEAVGKLIMYDFGVCFYGLFLIWLIVWMAIAGTKRSALRSSDVCGDQLWVLIVIFLIYLIGGFFVIVFSLFTECCRQPNWKRRKEEREAARGHSNYPSATEPYFPTPNQSPPHPSAQQQVPMQPVYNSNTSTYQNVARPPPMNPNYRGDASS
jgi:hypothetical protein